jgi:hypothetical protein
MYEERDRNMRSSSIEKAKKAQNHVAAWRASTRRGEHYSRLAGKRRLGSQGKMAAGVLETAFLPMAAAAFGGTKDTSDGTKDTKLERDRTVKFSVPKQEDDEGPEGSE